MILQNNKFDNLENFLDRMISTTDLSKQLSKTINEVVKTKTSKIIIKNNDPEAVLMYIEEYKDLMEMKENADLLNIVVARMEDYDPNNLIDKETILKKHNIDKEEIKKAMDFVEID